MRGTRSCTPNPQSSPVVGQRLSFGRSSPSAGVPPSSDDDHHHHDAISSSSALFTREESVMNVGYYPPYPTGQAQLLPPYFHPATTTPSYSPTPLLHHSPNTVVEGIHHLCLTQPKTYVTSAPLPPAPYCGLHASLYPAGQHQPVPNDGHPSSSSSTACAEEFLEFDSSTVPHNATGTTIGTRGEGSDLHSTGGAPLLLPMTAYLHQNRGNLPQQYRLERNDGSSTTTTTTTTGCHAIEPNSNASGWCSHEQQQQNPLTYQQGSIFMQEQQLQRKNFHFQNSTHRSCFPLPSDGQRQHQEWNEECFDGAAAPSSCSLFSPTQPSAGEDMPTRTIEQEYRNEHSTRLSTRQQTNTPSWPSTNAPRCFLSPSPTSSQTVPLLLFEGMRTVGMDGKVASSSSLARKRGGNAFQHRTRHSVSTSPSVENNNMPLNATPLMTPRGAVTTSLCAQFGSDNPRTLLNNEHASSNPNGLLPEGGTALGKAIFSARALCTPKPSRMQLDLESKFDAELLEMRESWRGGELPLVNRLNNFLFIGGEPSLATLEELKKCNVRNIVNCGEAPNDLSVQHGFKVHSILTEDANDYYILLYRYELFRDTLEKILSVSENEKVFVHCIAGVNRSVTLCFAFLMEKFDLSPLDVLHLFQTSGRPKILANAGFRKQIVDFYLHHVRPGLLSPHRGTS